MDPCSSIPARYPNIRVVEQIFRKILSHLRADREF
jgi:hypothetical protein